MDRKSTIAVAVKLAGICIFVRGSVNMMAPLIFRQVFMPFGVLPGDSPLELYMNNWLIMAGIGGGIWFGSLFWIQRFTNMNLINAQARLIAGCLLMIDPVVYSMATLARLSSFGTNWPELLMAAFLSTGFTALFIQIICGFLLFINVKPEGFSNPESALNANVS
jgi:hypothetical protein